MSTEPTIRHVEPSDVETLRDIYNHYIRESPATFDLEPKTLEDRHIWLEQSARTGPHQCLVAVRDGHALGWACSGNFKGRGGYATTVETSVYLAPGETGHRLGHRLYETLFAALAEEDLHRAVAGIVPPNPASVALHQSYGLKLIGTFGEVGFKFDRYWDVQWYEKPLDG